jgi:hypothetical protein
MKLTPEERQRIFEEENARLEAQQELVKAKAVPMQRQRPRRQTEGVPGV